MMKMHYTTSRLKTLNVSKTKEMCTDFRKNQRCPKSIYIKGEAVERVDTYKCLGVVFDSKLNWKENINSLLKKSALENVLHEKAEYKKLLAYLNLLQIML